MKDEATMVTNDQTVTQALEPCPFCGGVARIETTRHQHPPSHWVECAECEALSGEYASKASAVAAWNTRTAHSGEGRGNGAGSTKRDCYATAVRDLAKMDHVSAALKCVLFDCADLLEAKDEEIHRLSAPQGEVGR